MSAEDTRSGPIEQQVDHLGGAAGGVQGGVE